MGISGDLKEILSYFTDPHLRPVGGNPVGPVIGNLLCWYGLLEWLIKDVKNPDRKLIQNQWVV